MNIVNKFFLWLLLLPKRFYESLGVNVTHLRVILATKLLMDDRRVPPMQQMKRRRQQRLPKYATLGTMLVSALLGALFLFVFGIGSDLVTQLTFYFIFYVFMLAALLITDFTTVLIDVRDNLIILPKPVNDNTFLLARLLHIVIHVGKIMIPMALPAAIYLAINSSLIGTLTFLLLVICGTLFTIFLVNAVYVVILRLTTPEKFKNVISYFQIVFAILVYGGYQLLPRMVSSHMIATYNVRDIPFHRLLPPYWLAAGWGYVMDGKIFASTGLFFLLSLALPVPSIWLVIRFFAPSFNRKLSMIGGSEISTAKKANASQRRKRSGYSSLLAKWFTRGKAEHMAFLQTWKMTARSRDFRMKVYPSIGYLLVYVAVIILQFRKSPAASNFDATGSMLKYLFIGLIYVSSYSLMMAIYQLIYSEQYKASWFYYIAPVAKPGRLLTGALKSVTAKFYAPVAVAVCILSLIFIGPSIIPNLLVSLSNQLVIVLMIGYVSLRALPFSQPQSDNVKGSNFLRGLFTMIFPLILAFVHFFAYNSMPALIVLFVLGVMAIWLLLDALANKDWGELIGAQLE